MRRFRRRDILATTTALALGLKTGAIHAQGTLMHPDLILVNARFTTLDRANPNPEAVAIAGGRARSAIAAAPVLQATSVSCIETEACSGTCLSPLMARISQAGISWKGQLPDVDRTIADRPKSYEDLRIGYKRRRMAPQSVFWQDRASI